MKLETFKSMPPGTKGLLYDDGLFVAWAISDRGAPHHDDVAKLYVKNLSWFAKVTHWRDNNYYIDVYARVYDPRLKPVIEAMSSICRDTMLTVTDMPNDNAWSGTKADYASMLRTRTL